MDNTVTKRAIGLAMALVLAFGMCVPTAAAHAAGELVAASTGTAGTQATTNTITFTNGGATASSDTGIKISGTEVTISKAGTYLITGSCSEGNVKVKKETTGVTLILQDLALASSTTAPLAINKSCGDTTVQVMGTVTLIDKENPANETSTDADVADAFEGAAVKVKAGSNLAITGTGTLTADGSACKNAIKGASTSAISIGTNASDAVKVVAKAANNGIASDGSVVVNGGTITVEAGNDGVKSEPDEGDADSAGTITVNGGTLNITSTGDGMQATNDLDIEGGAVTVVASGGHSNAKSLPSDSSAKGLKSDKLVHISGGTFNLNTADDSIHSNGDVELYGGTFTISSGDDGVKADYNLTVGQAGSQTGPAITIANAYEGIEGANVTFNSGTVDITSSDDGVNAANGDFASSDDASLRSYTFNLTINGGTIRVNAGGDGLDSNGNITMNGGTVEVFGSADNGNAAMDYGDSNCSWTQNGGTIIAVGMSGMAVTPTSGTYVAFGVNGMGAGMGMNLPGSMAGGQFPSGAGNGQTPGNMGNGQQQRSTTGGQQPAQQRSGATGGNQWNPMTTTQESNLETEAFGGQPGFGQTTPGSFMATATGNAISITQGSSIAIKDASGNTLYSTTGKKSANSVVFSSSDLTSGSTYSLYVNGTEAASATAATGSGQPGGQQGNAQPGRPESANQQPGQGGQQPSDQPGTLPEGQPTDQPSGQTGEQPADQTAPSQETGNTDSSRDTGSTDSGNNTSTDNATVDTRADLSGATVSKISNKGYTGSAIKPKPTVKVNGVTLKDGTDYTLSYADNVKRGTATVTITAAEGSAKYKGSTNTTFTIVKGANPLTVAAAKKTVSASQVASKAKTLKALYVVKAKGSVKYTRVSGSKYLKVKSNGRVVVAKGTPAGTYKVKVKVHAAGNGNFNAKTVTKTVKVVVK